MYVTYYECGPHLPGPDHKAQEKCLSYKHTSISKIGWLLGKIVFLKMMPTGDEREKVNIFRKHFSLFSQA